jgi:hypothetical protein
LIRAGAHQGRSYEVVDTEVHAGMTYAYRLEAIDLNGARQFFELGSVTIDRSAPARVVLHQNRPNPFNPATTIDLAVPHPAAVRLLIHDASGRRVRTLIDARLAPGVHSIDWDGRNDRGSEVGSGVYTYRLEVGAEVAARKMTLIR